MIDVEFKEILYKEAKKSNIELDNIMLDKFLMYKKLLLEWNKKINLTAICDDYEIILKHFIDCLEITKYINFDDKVIDIGTGAGFPGIVIAIYYNDINITLVDALNKRIIFLNDIISNLNLNNIEILHSRAEKLAKDFKYREKFDVVVSRAVAPLNILLELDTPFLKIGGRGIFMKSYNISEELEMSKNTIKILQLKYLNKYNYSYCLNSQIYKRCILCLSKIDKLPLKYPRSFSKIKNSPI